MKFVAKILGAVILSFGGVISIYSQECPLDPLTALLPGSKPLPLDECRMIADGKGSFYNKDNNIAAGVKLFLFGKPTDITTEKKTAAVRILNDVLVMRLDYQAPGKIIPISVRLELTSFSSKPFKYEANHKLTIHLDGESFLSENMEMWSPGYFRESFLLKMKYTDFLRFTAAKKIIIQLGETKIELKVEDIEALNDLNQTTKHLIEPTVYAPILFRL